MKFTVPEAFAAATIAEKGMQAGNGLQHCQAWYWHCARSGG